MNVHVDFERVRLAHKALQAELLAERTADGHWVGELASSPVATAAAVSALVVAHRSDAGAALQTSGSGSGHTLGESIVQGDLSELLVESLHWLARHQNEDGGWGDTPGGPSNIAATMLVRAAFRLTCVPAKYAGLTDRADQYIAQQDGASGLRRRFGKDKTLSAPILANCALAGLVPWRQVPTLAFELICLPPRWHRRLRMSVASYAVAAQVAVGLVKFHHEPPRNPLVRLARRWVRARSLAILQRMQPEDGGFMEGTPLTAFVVMSLAGIGLQNHPIVERGVEFLLASVRSDASWPVVTNLATWNTTLALGGLTIEPLSAPSPWGERSSARHVGHPPQAGRPVATGADSRHVSPVPPRGAVWQSRSHHNRVAVDDRRRPPEVTDDHQTDDDLELLHEKCLDWLLACQHNEARPLAVSPPGGWGWTDLPGALPETDDTAGVLLTLARFRQIAPHRKREQVEQSARRGIQWLLEQQNGNGGWPLFARDWGASPLDRSATDLTAHALRALAAWQRLWDGAPRLGPSWRRQAPGPSRISTAIGRGIEFLTSQQREDGSFVPLRFGNLHHAEERNPVYGTARVLVMCTELDVLESDLAQRAARWLVAAQHATGGWGPPRTPLDASGSYSYGSNTWRAKDALAQFCTVEETALAVDALLPLAETNKACAQAVEKGLSWLVDAVEQDRHRQRASIGLCFAKLWYDERLYSLVFASGALSRTVQQLAARREVVAPVS